MSIVIQGGAVATVDAAGTEHADGHVVIDGTRIVAVGPGSADPASSAAPRPSWTPPAAWSPPVWSTPTTTSTSGRPAASRSDDDLFGWLTTLYPVWEGLDEEVVGAAAAAGLGWLARTGCTSTTDHHYVFPRDGGDVLGATIDAARQVGLRFHPTRGSMDLGHSQGGLPPDSVVERPRRRWPAPPRPSTSTTTRRRGRCCGWGSRRARRSRSPRS